MAIVNFVNDSQPYINAQNLNEIQKGNIYSTNEVVIGKYGNKPLYRKIVNTGSISAQTWSLVSYLTMGISNVDFIACEWARMDKGSYIYEDLYSQSNRTQYFDSGISFWLSEQANDIVMSLVYTKTTD